MRAGRNVADMDVEQNAGYSHRFPIGLHDMALRPVTRNQGDWLQSVAMHISRMPAAVTGVLRNPELVAAGGLPRMSEVCRCDKCFSRTVNGAGTVACARRVIYTVAPSAIASKLALLPASAYI